MYCLSDAVADRPEVQHLGQHDLVGSKAALPCAIRTLEVHLIVDRGIGQLRQWMIVAARLQVAHDLPDVLQGHTAPLEFGGHGQGEQVQEAVQTDSPMGADCAVDRRWHQIGLGPVVHLAL